MPTATNPVWRETFPVRTFQIDPLLRVSPQTVFNFLQEAASNHSAAMGCAVDQLIPRGLTWVVSRIHLKMDRYPAWREQVTVATWPSAVQGRFAVRDFLLRDAKGGRVGVATSSWLIIDLKSRSAVADLDVIGAMPLNEVRALPDAFPRLAEPAAEQYRREYSVRLSDMDPNRHVNNVNYVVWMLETVPTETWRTLHLADVEVSFKAESFYGDEIESVSDRVEEEGETVFRHQVRRVGDGKELARMKSTWTKPPQKP